MQACVGICMLTLDLDKTLMLVRLRTSQHVQSRCGGNMTAGCGRHILVNSK
jgi:hypothetical protein